MHRTYCLLTLLSLGLLWPLGLSGQNRTYEPGFQIDYFFGNHPSPRTEAMGRADVAVGGTVTSLFYNPAGLGLIQDWEADLSTSAPFYEERQANYYFAGYARRLHPKLVAAVSLHQLAAGPIPGFGVEVQGQFFPVDEPTSTNLALSVAAMPIEGLHIGLNANLFRWKLFDDVGAAYAPHVDLGALYVLPLNDKARLQAGASLTNVTRTLLTYQSPIGTESSPPFPTIGRVGLTYQQDFELAVPGADPQPLQWLLTVEGLDILNSSFRSTLRVGSEVVVARFIALRLGAYTFKWVGQPGGSGRDPRPRVSDITYGLGIILPLSELTDGKFPATLHVDVCSVEQPPIAYSSERFPNRRSLGLRLVSNLPTR